MSRFSKFTARLILTVGCLAITLGIIAFLFPQQFLTRDSGDVKADVLIVLGGGDGRAERAAELFRQGSALRVLVTGSGDCESNVQVLEKNGVPASVITAEPRALTTLENAKFSIPLLRKMGVRRAIIVTSWFHSRRALACFEHFAPEIKFYSRPAYVEYRPKKLNREGFSEHVNVEYAKLVEYLVCYGVWPF
jgi:uncharacterized SAM-binding protein YcdF (DUF218 family)